jgi:diguanylate cyclase (GGDEF)-like protein/PAS domain S-box-containing protein
MEPTATGTTKADIDGARFSREWILDPINLTLIPNLFLLAAAHHFGLIAPEPLWAVLGALAFAHLSAIAFATCFPMGTRRAHPKGFLALTIGLGGLCLYITGWGAVFAVVLVAAAAVVIYTEGSRYGHDAMLTIVVTILAGEIGVALGIFKSMISKGAAHGIALVETAIIVLVVSLVTRGQREKELAETRQKDSEERFRALVQHASDAIVVVDDDGRVTYASPAVLNVLGCAPDTLESFDVTWIDPDHQDAMVELWRRLRTQPAAVASVEVPVRRVDGTSRWVEVHVTNLSGNPAVGGFVCNLRDIGERRVAQLQLLHDAHHDPLTQLPNRRRFLERLDDAWSRATPDDLIAVLFIDVDNFKGINDRHGHATGDEALVIVADTLSSVVRPGDLVTRLGGDEFTVLLEHLHDIESAREIVRRITTRLSGARQINGHLATLSVSVGLATSTGKTKSPRDLVRDADHAMYRAKQSGRVRHAVAEPQFSSRIL